MNLINSKDYFSESEKVLEIVKQKEDQLHRQIPTSDRLRIVEAELKQAKSREEYEQLKQIKEDLELRVRLNEKNEDAIPIDHQEQIRRNREIEEEQTREKLNELKKELSSRIADLESELLPLVTNIVNLERRRDIGRKVDILLKSKIHEDPRILSAIAATRTFSTSHDKVNSDQAKASRARALIVKVLDQLKSIETPVETKGFFKHLKKAAK